MMSAGEKQLILLAAISLLTLAPWHAEAKGEGQKILMSRGSLLHGEMRHLDKTMSNTMFGRQASRNTISPEVDEADYENYVEMIKRPRVDVVAPGRGLTNLMNTVTTKVLAQLLVDHDDDFAELNMGEIKRPMLKAYMSVRLASDEDISVWSKLRSARNFSEGCKRLLEQRDETLREEFGDVNSPEYQKLTRLVDELKERELDRHHLAYLVFENNLNLFILENFLILCNRAELDEEIRGAFASYKPLF